jgi:hypothetical protein
MAGTKPQYGWSVAEDGRARLLKLVAAVVVLAAAVLHFVYLATHWNDRLMALLCGLIGAVQAWLAVALGLSRPNAAQIALGINACLIALFFAARVAGPPVGIKPEVVGSLTVLRKALEALAVLLLVLSLRRPKVPSQPARRPPLSARVAAVFRMVKD